MEVLIPMVPHIQNSLDIDSKLKLILIKSIKFNLSEHNKVNL